MMMTHIHYLFCRNNTKPTLSEKYQIRKLIFSKASAKSISHKIEKYLKIVKRIKRLYIF